LKATEKTMKRNAGLKAAIVDYARTRPVFEEYKAQKYSNKYLAEHAADIAIHRGAKFTMKELLNGEKLPKMHELKTEWQRLLSEKKSGYSEYRATQKDMREIIAVKANIDHLLGIAGREKDKADRPQPRVETELLTKSKVARAYKGTICYNMVN